MTISSRDYAEKFFTFFSDGVVYRFTSGIPKSEVKGSNGKPPICPIPDRYTVRAFTFINIAMCYRDP